MTAEPTMSLTYRDLIIRVAEALGVAFYGELGDEVAQPPEDAHDLAKCQQFVNDGIRMFIADGPSQGWRWQRPVASVVLWAAVAVDSSVTASGVYAAETGRTTITASADTFYESMEYHNIVVTDTGTFEIIRYVSARKVEIAGENEFSGKTFSVTSDGNYTLPRTFSGSFLGDITFAAGTNRGIGLEWTDESTIRALRANDDDSSTTPFLAAVRRVPGWERRWELMTYPISSGTYTVQFPYEILFDSLTDLDEYHPAGAQFDDTVEAAVTAAAEMKTDGLNAGFTAYYQQKALGNALKIDARSAPTKLGRRAGPFDSHGIRNPRHLLRRPNVSFIE